MVNANYDLENSDDLIAYVRNKSEDEIKTVFDTRGVNIIDDDFGQGVLHTAISRNKDVIEYFLDRGANFDLQDYELKTPLHYAAEHQNLAAVRLLLNAGARTDLDDRFGNQPLWTAVMSMKKKSDDKIGLEIVELILGANADLDHVNKAGRSPRMMIEIFGDQQLSDLTI